MDRWVRDGRLHLRYPGVFAHGRPNLATEGELAAGLLYAGSGSALGGISALWWLGLLHRRPDLIHVDARGRRASRDDLLIRHPGEVERRMVRELPVVPLPRALLVATGALSHDSLRLVIARAEFRHLLDAPLIAIVPGAGSAGRLRPPRRDGRPPTAARPLRQRLVRAFVLLCERFDVELPEPNSRIGRYRPDMLWRRQRLIVELDGKDAHSTPAQIAADGRRQAELERMGYTVIRFTWREVQLEPERLAAQVRLHLA